VFGNSISLETTPVLSLLTSSNRTSSTLLSAVYAFGLCKYQDANHCVWPHFTLPRTLFTQHCLFSDLQNGHKNNTSFSCERWVKVYKCTSNSSWHVVYPIRCERSSSLLSGVFVCVCVCVFIFLSRLRSLEQKLCLIIFVTPRPGLCQPQCTCTINT
jgi:hypothetical protein